MNWINFVYLFFGGLFLCNSIPHIVSGIMGRAFQSPFAKPPGEGLSSSTINVVWGFFNATAAYFLLVQLGTLDPHSILEMLSVGLGALLIALYSAYHFGKFNGGNPDSK